MKKCQQHRTSAWQGGKDTEVGTSVFDVPVRSRRNCAYPNLPQQGSPSVARIFTCDARHPWHRKADRWNSIYRSWWSCLNVDLHNLSVLFAIWRLWRHHRCLQRIKDEGPPTTHNVGHARFFPWTQCETTGRIRKVLMRIFALLRPSPGKTCSPAWRSTFKVQAKQLVQREALIICRSTLRKWTLAQSMSNSGPTTVENPIAQSFPN